MQQRYYINSYTALAILIAFTAAVALMLNTAIMANAQSAPLNYPAVDSTPAPMVLQAQANGDILIRGTVTGSGKDILTISSWGGEWTIRMKSGGMVFSSAQNSTGDLSSIGQGDFVGVMGTVASDNPYTIDATVLRDWTTTPVGGTGSASPTVMPSPSPSGILSPTETPSASPSPTPTMKSTPTGSTSY